MMSQPEIENPLEDKALAKRSDLHLLRKIWHIGIGSLCLFCYYHSDMSKQTWSLIGLVIGLSGFAVDLLRPKIPAFNRLIILVMGPFMRSSEKQGITGLPFYALGISLALFFYSEKLALLSVFFLVFSDPISSFFGVLYGKDKILPNKSLQGALAGFFTCFIITVFYGISYDVYQTSLIVFAVIAGVIGSTSELLSAFNIDDNLTIPVLSGLGLTVLNYFLPLF